MGTAEVISTSVTAGLTALAPVFVALLERRQEDEDDSTSTLSTRAQARKLKKLEAKVQALTTERDQLQDALDLIMDKFPEVELFVADQFGSKG